MIGFRKSAFICALVLSLLLAAPSSLFPGAVDAQEATPVASGSGQAPVLLFAAPGMRPDLVETFAAEGALPAMAELLDEGARADGGLREPYPATTGPSLATLLTGTWPAEHGIVGDRFFRTGSPDFADFATWSDPGLIQADTLPQAAERAGKQVVSVGWESVSTLDPPLGGPVVSGPVPYSQSGVVTNIEPCGSTGKRGAARRRLRARRSAAGGGLVGGSGVVQPGAGDRFHHPLPRSGRTEPGSKLCRLCLRLHRRCDHELRSRSGGAGEGRRRLSGGPGPGSVGGSTGDADR